MIVVGLWPPPADDLVAAVPCFQTRLLLVPTVARRRCLPDSRSLVTNTEPLLTWSFLTVIQRDPCCRWIRSLPLSGALPHAWRVVREVRLVTNGNFNAVSEGFGLPSWK